MINLQANPEGASSCSTRGQDFTKVDSILQEIKKTNYLTIFEDHEISDAALDCIQSKEEMRNILKDMKIPMGIAIRFSSCWFDSKEPVAPATDKNNNDPSGEEPKVSSSDNDSETPNTEPPRRKSQKSTSQSPQVKRTVSGQAENDKQDRTDKTTNKLDNKPSTSKNQTVNDQSVKEDESVTEVKKTPCTRRTFGTKVENFEYPKGSIFMEEENREIEFKALTKETREKLPWKIMEKARVFICGVLNAGGKGTIYFGIGDSYDKANKFARGEVIGLEVEELKDEINKAFQSTLDDHIKSDDGKMKKGGDMNCVNIYFVPVKENDQRTGRYAIEIEIKRDWKFCKDHVYYFKEWTEKRESTLKGGLHDLYKVNKEKWEDPVIRTCGPSATVKNIDINKDIKEPLTQKYKQWQGIPHLIFKH